MVGPAKGCWLYILPVKTGNALTWERKLVFHFGEHEEGDFDRRALYQEISNNHPPSSAAGTTENIVLFQAAYVIAELYRLRGAFQLSFKVILQTWPQFAYRAEPSIESKQVKKERVFVFFLIACQAYSRGNGSFGLL